MADERDSQVSRRYGELGAEEPTRALDQAILAVARRAVDQPHAPLVAPAGRHRWYFPLAAAAILMLAVAVTVQIERQQPDPEAVQVTTPPQAPAQQEAAPQAAPPPAQPSVRRKAESPKVFAPDPVPQRAEEPAPAPAAPPPAAGPERREAAGAAADTAASRAREAAPAAARSAPAPAQRPAPMMRQESSARLATTPEQELEQIAVLRQQRRHDEADKALAEFRRRHPDYRIPEAMLEKIEKK